MPEKKRRTVILSEGFFGNLKAKAGLLTVDPVRLGRDKLIKVLEFLKG